MRASRVFKAGRLAAIHALGEIAVQKSVGDVELMDEPVLGGDRGEHGADGGGLDGRGESFDEVDPWSLYVAAHYPPCLVVAERAVGAGLDLELPFP